MTARSRDSLAGRVHNLGYRALLLVGALYWLGAAWVALDLRIPLHSRTSRNVPTAERGFYGGFGCLAAAMLLYTATGRKLACASRARGNSASDNR